ncbi:hypothetical protein KAW65_04430 [candidate division WOR-3 bacterium]|nr:hypothetical protein [candidate division WOR-3 bacterium]
MLKKIANIDRRIIFIVIVLCIIIPFLTKTVLEIRVSAPVKSAYKALEKLESGSCVLFSVDYDPASQPELQPMLIAVLRHAFKKNLKVIMMCHWPLGFPLGQDALMVTAKEYDKKYGQDYVNLGYRPGMSAIMLGIGREIRDFFASDYAGTPVDSLDIMKGVHNYGDITLLIGFEAGATGDYWVRLAGAQFGQKITLGCTAVCAPDCYPYLQAKQIEGLIGGLKGAAEYEKLVECPGAGIIGMTAQSAGHIAIIIFIILGNLSYFILKKREKE